MTAGTVTRVVVAADVPGLDVSASTATLPGNEPTTVVPAQLACRVQARLSGVDFDLDPQGYQPQSFIVTTHVEWSWQVEPRVSGSNLPLQLEVQGVVQTPQGLLAEGTRTFVAQIAVTSSPESFWTHVNDAVSGFVRHPLIQFIGAAGFGGGILWLVERSRRTSRRLRAAPPVDPDRSQAEHASQSR